MVPPESATIPARESTAEPEEVLELFGVHLMRQRKQLDGPVKDRRPSQKNPLAGLDARKYPMLGLRHHVTKDRLGALCLGVL